MKFTIHHNTTNEDEYDEIMGVIMKWERIDALNQNAISTFYEHPKEIEEKMDDELMPKEIKKQLDSTKEEPLTWEEALPKTMAKAKEAYENEQKDIHQEMKGLWDKDYDN